jgi:Tol biopolymer transport system component
MNSDGRKTAFSSNRNGTNDIYVMNADETNIVDLPNNNANDYAPVWAP